MVLRKNILDTITDAIEKVERTLLFALFAEVIIVGFLQVLFRFIVQSSLSWSEELMRFSFIWLTYLAASLGIMKGTHATVDIILENLPGGLHNTVKLIIELLTLGFCTTIFVCSLQVVGMQMARGQVSAAMGLPIWIPYGGIVISFGFMVVQCISRTISAARKLGQPRSG